MLISSPRHHSTINIENIEPKDYINYLEVSIDNHLNWQPQIQHINNKIAKNAGILTKLRYHIDFHMLKQMYYALLDPNFGCYENEYPRKRRPKT